jgi:hypothetical protein
MKINIFLQYMFIPEDGGSIFFWNVGIYVQVRMTSQARAHC